MKRRTLCILLTCEAFLCFGLLLGRGLWPRAFTAAAAVPFEQVGLGLRALSLSGAAGNAAAIALYVLFCLLPLGALLLIRRRRALQREDWLLPALSGLLFLALYYMINPQLMTNLESGMGKAVLGLTVWSVIVGYGLLRLLRLLSQADTGRLHGWLSGLLWVLAMLFLFSVFYIAPSAFLDARAALREGNTARPAGLALTELFLALGVLAKCAVPYALAAAVAIRGLALLAALREDRYSPASVAAAEGLSRLCASALKWCVLALAAFNVLQVLAMKTLLSVNTSLSIPVAAVAFVLGMLLLARYTGENKALKDDNDLFI